MTYLQGLTVNVYDISFDHPDLVGSGGGGNQIGSATYINPNYWGPASGYFLLQFAPSPVPGPWANTGQTGPIVQDYTGSALGGGYAWVPGVTNSAGALVPDQWSAATALFEVPAAGVPGYLGPNIQVELAGPGGTVFGQIVFWDVDLYTAGAAPTADALPGIQTVSAYVTLGPQVAAGVAQLQLAADGTPPDYDSLLAAVNAVLGVDPGPAGTTLAALIGLQGPLSLDQCTVIAQEIVWDIQPPLPALPDPLDELYTDPPNTGQTSNQYEQDLQQFQGNLSSYYSTLTAAGNRLAGCIFALSAALWCENQTIAQTSALLDVPIITSSTMSTVTDAELVITGNPVGIDVPAQYFYALGSGLPPQVTPSQRYANAVIADPGQTLQVLMSAITDGVIAQPPLNPAQAVQHLAALNVPSSSSVTQYALGTPTFGDLDFLWNQWLNSDWNFPVPGPAWATYQLPDQITGFWEPLLNANPPPSAAAQGYLDLVLYLLTEGYVDSGTGVPLAVEIERAPLVAPLQSVTELMAATPVEWEGFFGNPIVAARLPPFTLPGTLGDRVQAFIRRAQQFFDVAPAAPPAAGAAGVPAAPVLPIPTSNLISSCLGNLGGGFLFGNAPTNLLALQGAAAATVADPEVQAWLADAMATINDLAFCTNIGQPAAEQFSMIEALFASGFTSRESITVLSQGEFEQALTGTVAYGQAVALYNQAGGGGGPGPGPGGPFGPVNDGSLTDCIPPCQFSPFSPVAYLYDMLRVSEGSTCDDPFAHPAPGHQTLSAAVESRRGPLGNLHVTCANLDTSLPTIDMVNECLEHMVASGSRAGVVYDTPADKVGDHEICQHECCSCPGCCDNDELHDPGCHEAQRLLGVLPVFSTPALPNPATAAVEKAAFDTLRRDFSSCRLPYSKPLDVSRSYLRYLGTCRYETMRTFHRCITEFVLDPTREPPGFRDNLWRFPVRVDIAIESLGISPEEYRHLFHGPWPRPCGDVRRRRAPAPTFTPQVAAVFASDRKVPLPELLNELCLSYCEFLELVASGFLPLRNSEDSDKGFPDCEPCCLSDVSVRLPEEGDKGPSLEALRLFVRLWHKLREHCNAHYSFAQLADICEVFHLFVGGAPNPDFIRQLAAFQMLRDYFELPITDPRRSPPPGATGAERTFILALWAGPHAPERQWAVDQLMRGVEVFALSRFECDHRRDGFVESLIAEPGGLSRLAGFDPPAHSWDDAPTCTIRFAEVLTKIYASNFGIDEVAYLFSAERELNGGVFACQGDDDALELPLDLPDDLGRHSLSELRQKLLHLEQEDGDEPPKSWYEVERVLCQELGFDTANVLELGRHFFPETLERGGLAVTGDERKFEARLAGADTDPRMWATSPAHPFLYDAPGQRLWARLPLPDAAVMDQLMELRGLRLNERAAVRDLYFQPRAILASFSLLFEDFRLAEQRLIGSLGEDERWEFFCSQLARFRAKRWVIAEHLAAHVSAMSEEQTRCSTDLALAVLDHLAGDENRNKPGTDWEADGGLVPDLVWGDGPLGGAVASLMGLTGTGLRAEYTTGGPVPVWREVGGPLVGFGRDLDEDNCPVPTVVPALDLDPSPAQAKVLRVRNGFGFDAIGGERLGGVQGFTVKWAGALLVDEEGTYEFRASDRGNSSRWRVVLTQGQRTWTVLSHGWPSGQANHDASVHLRRGAYSIDVDFHQGEPGFGGNPVAPQHTGFAVEYKRPGTADFVIVPQRALFVVEKQGPLDEQIAGLADAAATYLRRRYISSLRDIRRTYQRAFKALLFVHRFGLSAELEGNRYSELGYMLSQRGHPKEGGFSGASYYRALGGYVTHLADLDFDFFPLFDNYHAPTPLEDARARPALKRVQALFDWWERLFDYTEVRRQVRRRRGRELWPLFAEAYDDKPDDPGYLLGHICADASHWRIDLTYFQDTFSPVLELKAPDLVDERWAVRAWHAERWAECLWKAFGPKEIAAARPDLWSATDPAAPLPGPLGLRPPETGNANLVTFVEDGCLERGLPRRYEDLRRLNDGLRERGRNALLAYLCRPGGFPSPEVVSGWLLTDVEVGVSEKASRIDEAISAVQTFVQRARVGLEGGTWRVSPSFASMWDSRFGSFAAWEACKRRQLYKENVIEWEDLERARSGGAFALLEDSLSRSLSVARPGAGDYWPDQRPPEHLGLAPLQDCEPVSLDLLSQGREGLDLLATPERAGRPTWLTMVQDPLLAPPPQQPLGPGPAAAPQPGRAQLAGPTELPYWMRAGIEMGATFIRVAAAGCPPASTDFKPRRWPAPGVQGNAEEPCVRCCEECGREHPVRVDEYYFWLIASQHFDPFTQDDYYDATTQDATPWHDPTQLPGLLDWAPAQTARLAWCRVHNGEFQMPRRSAHGIPLEPGPPPDISFEGRTGDSLYFSVINAVTPAPAPGFRYDVADDHAIALWDLPVPAAVGPGGLAAYPFFVYFWPGAPVFPSSPFAVAITVACALRSHCQFEAALKWYCLAFDPLRQDCTWVHCDHDRRPDEAHDQDNRGGPDHDRPKGGARSGCCDSTAVSCEAARRRSVLLHYLETLLEWADAKMRANHPEAFQQARVLLDTARQILGPPPRVVQAGPPAGAQMVSGFKATNPPLNPRLMALYDHVDDRLDLVRHSVNAARLHNGEAGCVMGYFDRGPMSADRCCERLEWCHLPSPYRFAVLVGEAQELAGRARDLGAELLSAFEKGDAEYLAALHARNDYELAVLTRKIREDQWRDADWQVQALQLSKQSSQQNRGYYAGLIAAGLNTDELGYVSSEGTSMGLRTAAIVSDVIAEVMDLVPDIWVGFPCEETQIPVGSKLAGMFRTIAQVSSTLAEIASTNASEDLTQAGWGRRAQDWTNQVAVLDIQIHETEVQILAADRRRSQALRELDSQQRQIEQSEELARFLRDKFTSHGLYLWLQKETMRVYWQTYELALGAARQAEKAYNLELGYTAEHFIRGETWDDWHEGLLAGDRLQLCLARMEKGYRDRNVREYELTKHISLRQNFPTQFLQLKLTGRCEIELCEWMFDVDYPGQYMRRVKSVSLSIPCVVGPYTGVHCRLTLLSSMTRVDPTLASPRARCCSDQCDGDCYEACPHDERTVRDYGARESIATSSGQNDAGLFELSFHDDRYLPFEYHGAVSRWRLELPIENNYFRMDTLSDVVMHLNYTSREGGDMLRRAASKSAADKLPACGWAFIDVRYDEPDAWARFQAEADDRAHERWLNVWVDRNSFPYIPDAGEVRVDRVMLLFEAERENDCECGGECACRENRGAALHEVRCRYVRRGERPSEHEQRHTVGCVEVQECRDLYEGVFETSFVIGHERGYERGMGFQFPPGATEVTRVYLFCHYDVARERDCDGGHRARP